MTRNERSPRPIRLANPESETRSGARSALPLSKVGGGSFVGVSVALAERMSSGLDRRSFGYERSSSLVEAGWAPTTTSFHPIRPG